jgi:glutathionyl-hydroquinone reductase
MEGGEFVRPQVLFRNTDVSCVPGRYAVYVNGVCPWAQRVKTTTALLGMESSVRIHDIAIRMQGKDLSYRGWILNLTDPFHANMSALCDVYDHYSPGYSNTFLRRGKRPICTVPILVDLAEKRIVNTESADIMRMLNGPQFRPCRGNAVDLSPSWSRSCEDEVDELVYEGVNNGVYRMGYAKTQEAYETAYAQHWEAMDALEERLGKSRFLCGPHISLSDVKLFATTVRFDAAYHVRFRASRNKLIAMPNLMRHMVEVYRYERVSETVDMKKIVKGYYASSGTYALGQIRNDYHDNKYDKFLLPFIERENENVSDEENFISSSESESSWSGVCAGRGPRNDFLRCESTRMWMSDGMKNCFHDTPTTLLLATSNQESAIFLHESCRGRHDTQAVTQLCRQAMPKFYGDRVDASLWEPRGRCELVFEARRK